MGVLLVAAGQDGGAWAVALFDGLDQLGVAVETAAGGGVAGDAVAVDWISARLADGTFDCLYLMAGGGRLIIANVADEETLLAMLRSAPDAPREWTFTELFDGIEVIRNYVASMRP